MATLSSAILLVAAVAGSIPPAQSPTPAESSSKQRYPECPAGDWPTVRDEPVTSPDVGSEGNVEAGGDVATGDYLRLKATETRIEREVVFSGERMGVRFEVTVPPQTVSKVETSPFREHLGEHNYRLSGTTLRFVGPAAPSNDVFPAKIWAFSPPRTTDLIADISLEGVYVEMTVHEAPISRTLCRYSVNPFLHREIIFGGVVKGVVALQYRESHEGMARPAFSQDGSFDLAEGKDIAFKGVHLTVLSASNTGLRYVVTHAFPPE